MAASKKANNNLQPAYGRGWFVLGYGVIWLALLAAGGWFLASAVLPTMALEAALAGGIGGTVAMLQRLYRHLTVQQDWPGQSLLTYLLQPITGLIAGMLSLLLITLPGGLLVSYATTRTLSPDGLAGSSTFVALSLLLAWIAGYYQEAALAKIRAAARRSASKALTPPTDPMTAKTPESGDAISESPLAFQTLVKQRRQRDRRSLLGGLMILAYGLIGLAALLVVFLEGDWLFPAEAEGNRPLINLLAVGWPAILAGGVGGVIGMLYNLYRHISFEHDFDRSHLIAYPTLPLTGLVLGGAMYLFIASGYFSLKNLVGAAAPTVDAPAVLVGYIILGWLAGFRQDMLHSLIRRLVQALTRFARGAFAGMSPKVLWNQRERDSALSEVAQQWEMFRAAEHDTAPRLKDKFTPSE